MSIAGLVNLPSNSITTKTVEILCSVIEQQAALINDLSKIIEESNTIDKETKRAFAERRNALNCEVSEVY